jgi:hypothetical protein
MDTADNFVWRKKRTPGECIGDTFTVIKKYFKPLASSVLVICGPVILLSAFFYRMYGQETFQPSRILSEVGYTVFKNAIINTVFFLFSTSLVSTVVLSFLKLVIEGNEKPTLAEVWDRTKSNLLKCFLISFLVALLFIGMALVTMVLISYIGVFAIVLLVMGFIVLSFYLVTKLNLSYCAAILNDLNATNAMARSWDYTSGYFWSTAGVWILSYLVTSCIAFVVYLPAYIMTITAAFSKELPEVINSPLYKIFTILYSFTILIFSTLILISMSMHYLNLEERMEGTGLLERIDSMGVQNENKNWGEENF